MKKILAVLAVLLPVAASAADTKTATDKMTVKATITSSCVLNTSSTGTKLGDTELNFGSISSLSAGASANTNASGAGAVNVLCNKGTGWSIAFGNGENYAAGQRNMKGGSTGTDVLPYNLYTDSAHSNKIETAAALTGTGSGQVQSTQIFGQIPAGTLLPSVGNYQDTVTLTVTY